MFIGIEIDMLGLAHELVKDAGELREPADVFDSGNAGGLFLGVFVAFPGFEQCIRFPEE